MSMSRPKSRSQPRDNIRPALSFALHDLDARVVTLDRYGLAGFGSALADGLRSLFGASRSAICGLTLSACDCGRDC
jgi:hypothetical protein